MHPTAKYIFVTVQNDIMVLIEHAQYKITRMIVEKKLSPEHEQMLDNFTPQDRKYMKIYPPEDTKNFITHIRQKCSSHTTHINV